MGTHINERRTIKIVIKVELLIDDPMPELAIIVLEQLFRLVHRNGDFENALDPFLVAVGLLLVSVADAFGERIHWRRHGNDVVVSRRFMRHVILLNVSFKSLPWNARTSATVRPWRSSAARPRSKAATAIGLSHSFCR